jgi:hypothetical protein
MVVGILNPMIQTIGCWLPAKAASAICAQNWYLPEMRIFIPKATRSLSTIFISASFKAGSLAELGYLMK